MRKVEIMSEKSKGAPFSKKETLFAIVKDMERRWGLTLASFLPPDAQEQVESLQEKVKKIAYGNTRPADPSIEPSIEFYKPSHLHCTHYTLTRSNAWGRVRIQDFVKSGHNLFELFEIINEITTKIPFINVKLDTLKVSLEGVGIILLGECCDVASVGNRGELLRHLNGHIEGAFKQEPRSWDRDPSKYHRLHCQIGFLKRPIENFDIFAKKVRAIDFDPITFTVKEVTIVHHRYRSLSAPHEGFFSIPLGLDRRNTISKNDFIRKLNLANI